MATLWGLSMRQEVSRSPLWYSEELVRKSGPSTGKLHFQLSSLTPKKSFGQKRPKDFFDT